MAELDANLRSSVPLPASLALGKTEADRQAQQEFGDRLNEGYIAGMGMSLSQYCLNAVLRPVASPSADADSSVT